MPAGQLPLAQGLASFCDHGLLFCSSLGASLLARSPGEDPELQKRQPRTFQKFQTLETHELHQVENLLDPHNEAQRSWVSTGSGQALGTVMGELCLAIFVSSTSQDFVIKPSAFSHIKVSLWKQSSLNPHLFGCQFYLGIPNSWLWEDQTDYPQGYFQLLTLLWREKQASGTAWGISLGGQGRRSPESLLVAGTSYACQAICHTGLRWPWTIRISPRLSMSQMERELLLSFCPHPHSWKASPPQSHSFLFSVPIYFIWGTVYICFSPPETWVHWVCSPWTCFGPSLLSTPPSCLSYFSSSKELLLVSVPVYSLTHSSSIKL